MDLRTRRLRWFAATATVAVLTMGACGNGAPAQSVPPTSLPVVEQEIPQVGAPAGAAPTQNPSTSPAVKPPHRYDIDPATFNDLLTMRPDATTWPVYVTAPNFAGLAPIKPDAIPWADPPPAAEPDSGSGPGGGASEGDLAGDRDEGEGESSMPDPTPDPTSDPTKAPTASPKPTAKPKPKPTTASTPLPVRDKDGRVDCKKYRCVALTFDDGPLPKTTGPLLDILAKEQVPATFFMLGVQANAHPQLVKRVAAEGHEIGSHTWSHQYLTEMPTKTIRDELTRTNALLKKLTGQQPTLLRPPYGATNANVAEAARQVGMAQILWSVDTRDWQHRDAQRVAAIATTATRGSIVLMHDIRESTVAALPGIIQDLRAKGYVFVTVSELLGPLKSGVEYKRR